MQRGQNVHSSERIRLLQLSNLMLGTLAIGAYGVANNQQLIRWLDCYQVGRLKLHTLKVDALVGYELVVKMMLNFGHVGNDIGQWHKFLRKITPGQTKAGVWRAMLNKMA